MDGDTSNIKSLKFQMIVKLCLGCKFKSNFFDWCDACKLKHFKLNYDKSPSGNNEIDNRLKYYYSKSGLSEEFIEWISYEEFKDITHNVVNKETYSALWSKGCICDWNKDKFNWNRKIKKVALVNFEYNIIDFYRVLKEKEQYKLYGISKDPTSHSYILVFDDEVYNQNLCVKCQILSNFFYWCKSCKLNHFQLNYGEFPSGNDEIDNILKDHYYDSISPKELIEWIPFNEFREIVLTADNKEIYNALWSKGCIYDWDEDKLSWIREVKKVTLVNFKCSINDFNIMVLKEKLYGISKDPTSHSYILVLDDEGYNQNLCINCQILSSFFDWCKSCKLNHFQLNYGEFPSKNNDIDNFLKNNYCESRLSEEFIEWIPYNEFEDIKYTRSEIFNAVWLKGCICDWDKDKFSWNRKIRKVIAVKFKCGFDTTIKALVEKEGFKIYGISKDSASPNYILVLDQILCIKCQGHGYFDWCKRCKLIKFQLSYGEYPSGNNDIDNFLKENCCESKFDNELIEWISYIELEDITYITIREDSSIKYYTAERNRMVLTLMEFENLNDLLNYKNKMQINMKKERPEPFKSYIIHGISKNPISLNYILVFEYSQDFLNFLNEPKDYQIIGISKDEKYKYNLVTYLKNFSHFLCSDCKPRKALFFNWCDDCKIEHFSHNYSDLPSKNNDINIILKDNYCKSDKISEFIEWIPYNLFIDITYINQGGFSEVYSALWLNNNIYEWDHIKLEWKRRNGYKSVALKVLKSSCYNISGFLQEVQSYCKIGFSHKITKLYGISKDPDTQNYILVLEYASHGSLRKFLDKYNKYLITTYKIQILKNIAEGLKEIHSKNIIHQDIHSENILTKDFDRVKITDLGSSKFVNQVNDKEKEKKVYGILPYIAPEVLRGQQYTQKADIYAFGIIINEVFTGERPFHDNLQNCHNKNFWTVVLKNLIVFQQSCSKLTFFSNFLAKKDVKLIIKLALILMMLTTTF
ncbi:kinase-like domain-containing protein [Rhizophagus irregularis DAOM 181602=DAOM 197198]|nr:kinase-like domain-containing protein [Rhizophagus irregularis DAOM 181602=DAOM 197198]